MSYPGTPCWGRSHTFNPLSPAHTHTQTHTWAQCFREWLCLWRGGCRGDNSIVGWQEVSVAGLCVCMCTVCVTELSLAFSEHSQRIKEYNLSLSRSLLSLCLSTCFHPRLCQLTVSSYPCRFHFILFLNPLFTCFCSSPLLFFPSPC